MPTPLVVEAISNASVRSGWLDVAHIKDPDGILGIVSRRVGGPPVHTVSIFKWYLQDGVEQKTTFWSPTKQWAAVQRVLAIMIPHATDLETAAFAAQATERAGARR